MSVKSTGLETRSGDPAGLAQKALSGALVTAALTIAIAGTTLEVKAADTYPPARAYREAAPAYRPAPPRVDLVPVPLGPPAGIVTDPAGWAYVVPAPAYQPGDEYFQAPAVVDGTRYYRDCWWEWGFYRCALKPRWFVTGPR